MMDNSVLPACYHCGEPAVAGMHADINGAEQPFCCAGCRAVAVMISGAGLSNYYQLRTEKSQKASEEHTELSGFDVPEFQARHVQIINDIATVYLHIEGMRCAACVWLIEKHLKQLAGLSGVKLNLSSNMAKIEWQQKQLNLSCIIQAIHQIGYSAKIGSPNRQHTQRNKTEYFRLGVAAFGMMQVGMFSFALYAGDWHGMNNGIEQLMRLAAAVVATAVLLISATPFFSSAWRALWQKKVVMDLPIAVAIGLAYSASIWATISHSGEVYFDSVAMFTFFLLLSRHIESSLKQRLSTQQEQGLMPQRILAAATGQSQQQARYQVPEALKINDQIWLEAGATLPVDGELLNDKAALDESVLTGESAMVNKTQGNTIYAGAINGEQVLHLRVSAVGSNTQLAKLRQLQFDAEQDKPQWQTTADAIAPYFIVAVLSLSLFSFITWSFLQADQALWVALAVLVVSCPCALSLATPTVYTAVLSTLAASGVIVNKSRAVERLANVTDVVFDKTGTLTQGKPVVSRLAVFSDVDEYTALAIAASVEQGVSHPLANAIKQYASKESAEQYPLIDQKIINGKGVQAGIKQTDYRLGNAAFCEIEADQTLDNTSSLVYLTRRNANSWQLLARFTIQDTLREDAVNTVKRLQQQGCKLHIASGDRQAVVNNVAQQLGIKRAQGECSATQKLSYIQKLQQQGRVVATVGDGLNDLPLLGGADVSIAVSNASDLTKSNTDVLLINPKLASLISLFGRSRCALHRIKQNMAWAIGYNAVMVPLAMCALLPPWLAALGMSLSSLVVVINAKRV